MPSIESSPLRTDLANNARHPAHGLSSSSRNTNPRIRMITEDERDDTTLSRKYGRQAIEQTHRSPSSGLALRQPNIPSNASEEVSFVTWAPTQHGTSGWRRHRVNPNQSLFRTPARRQVIGAPVLVGRPFLHQQHQHDPRFGSQPPLWIPLWQQTNGPYNRVGPRPPPPPFPSQIEIPRRIPTVGETIDHRPSRHLRAQTQTSLAVKRLPSVFRESQAPDPIANAAGADTLASKIVHPQTESSNKRQHSSQRRTDPIIAKKPKGFDKLDMLCSATLEIGELHENPNGCSCPKSKCIALYCDCFKAGRRCNPSQCSCSDCKNTIFESGPNGARTRAIRSILVRNPRAFTTAGMGNPLLKLPPGEIACSCVRSRCLKLYCSCFHHGKVCRPNVCTCVDCHNTDKDEKGHRQVAIQTALEKRPDAFEVKEKEKGRGCACKNNRCIRKYCECFRNGLLCTPKCSCRSCENNRPKHPESDEQPKTVNIIKSDLSDSDDKPHSVESNKYDPTNGNNDMSSSAHEDSNDKSGSLTSIKSEPSDSIDKPVVTNDGIFPSSMSL